MDCSTPGFPVHHILCYPLLLLPPIPPSVRVSSNGSALHIRWPEYCNFNFIIHLSNEYLGLISFRIDWFDLLVVQGTLKSLLQHHNSKASILQCSAFFMVQLSVILDQENKVCHCFHCFPIYLPWSDGTRCHDLRFLSVELRPTFSLSSFIFIKRLFSSSQWLRG